MAGIVSVSIYCIAVFCVVCVFWVFFCSVFPSVLWYCWLDLLTCKTVSHITYTVLVETLNHVQSINQSINQSIRGVAINMTGVNPPSVRCAKIFCLHRNMHQIASFWQKSIKKFFLQGGAVPLLWGGAAPPEKNVQLRRRSAVSASAL